MFSKISGIIYLGAEISETLILLCYSKAMSRCLSSFNVSDQVSHPYKTTGKIVALYILIFTFLDSKLEDKNSAPNDSKHFLTLICSQFLPE
jgi:hypothetical protein